MSEMDEAEHDPANLAPGKRSGENQIESVEQEPQDHRESPGQSEHAWEDGRVEPQKQWSGEERNGDEYEDDEEQEDEFEASGIEDENAKYENGDGDDVVNESEAGQGQTDEEYDDDEETEEEEYDGEEETDDEETDDEEAEEEEYEEEETDDDETEEEEYDDEENDDEELADSQDEECGEDELEEVDVNNGGENDSEDDEPENVHGLSGTTVPEHWSESTEVESEGSHEVLGAGLTTESVPPIAEEGGASTPQSADLNSHAMLHFQTVDLPTMHGEPFGMRRADANGCELLDAMAGRNSVFGFGCTPIRESLAAALSSHLGEGSRFANVANSGESPLSKKLGQVFAGSTSVSAESMTLLPSPDLAVEHALQMTRRFRSDQSFRTIAMLGSDHGRTGMCRTASGLPGLHEGLGPMMAGFSHLPLGNLEALRAAIDDQTAGVLISTIDLGNGAVACQSEYLAGVRAVCDERGALLIVDETQLVFGATGNQFAFSALADIQADIVIASGGLFAGLPGGLVLASRHAAAGTVCDLEQYPLLSAALISTLNEMEVHGLPDSVHDAARELAVSIAEQLSGFEFVRDMNVTGMTIGIECDVNAVDVVAAAKANGLRVESAGDTAIKMQPPLLISEEDRQLLLKRLVETMKAIERETAGLTL